jgi:hypothetical protein
MSKIREEYGFDMKISLEIHIPLMCPPKWILFEDLENIIRLIERLGSYDIILGELNSHLLYLTSSGHAQNRGARLSFSFTGTRPGSLENRTRRNGNPDTSSAECALWFGYF